MAKLTKLISDTWPGMKTWPREAGPLPTSQNISDAAVMAKAGCAVHMALACYMRTAGATDSEAAIAASAATGSKSATHRVKRDVLVAGGHLLRNQLAPRGGHTVVNVALAKPAKPASDNTPRKPRKPRKAAKPASDNTPVEAAKPASDNTPADATTQA